MVEVCVNLVTSSAELERNVMVDVSIPSMCSY